MLDLTNRTCIGCKTGCASCNYSNNSQCLVCDEGLSLFENDCYTECPLNYIRSKDGKICELRPYLLDGYLIYFPFGLSVGLILLICFASFIFTKGESEISSNVIALLCFSEIGSLGYLAFDAYQREYYRIFIAILGIYAFSVLINYIFLVFYCFRIRKSDPNYSIWKKRHYLAIPITLFLSLIFSHKLIRLLYSHLFRLRSFSCNIENDSSFIKYTKVFSIISIFTYSLPLIVFNSVVLLVLTWGTQLYINMIESGGITLISVIFIILEHCCPCKCCERACFPDAELRKKMRRSSS